MKDREKMEGSDSVRKADVVRMVAKQTGIRREDVQLVVDALMSTVQHELLSGRRICLRGFGVFDNRTRAKRVARNLKRNTSMVLPERRVPTFKPSKEWLLKTRGVL